MVAKKVHLIDSEGKDFIGEHFVESACGLDCEIGGDWKGTTIPQQVTCKRCRKSMNCDAPSETVNEQIDR